LIERLLSYGIEKENIKSVAKTGLVVDIKGKADADTGGECNVVAFRADMDALPISECNHDLAYKS